MGESGLFLLWAVVQPGLLAVVVSPRNREKLSLCSVINQSHHTRERGFWWKAIVGKLYPQIHILEQSGTILELAVGSSWELEFFFRLIIVAFPESLLEAYTVCVLIYLIPQQPYERGAVIIPTLQTRQIMFGEGESQGHSHSLWGTELVSRLPPALGVSALHSQLYALWLTLPDGALK